MTELVEGQRIKLNGARWRWTVMVAGDRYVILKRQAPFRPKGEYLYTILDYEEGVRGPVNSIGNGWDEDEAGGPRVAWRLLHVKLLSGRIEISRRQRVPFRPEDIELP